MVGGHNKVGLFRLTDMRTTRVPPYIISVYVWIGSKRLDWGISLLDWACLRFMI